MINIIMDDSDSTKCSLNDYEQFICIMDSTNQHRTFTQISTIGISSEVNMEKFIITKGLTKDPKELLGFRCWIPLVETTYWWVSTEEDYPDAKKQPHVQVSASAI